VRQNSDCDACRSRLFAGAYSAASACRNPADVSNDASGKTAAHFSMYTQVLVGGLFVAALLLVLQSSTTDTLSGPAGGARS
jgi:hypothetical protein